MKVRVYGYKFEAQDVPSAMSRLDIYEYLSANAGKKLGVVYQYGAEKLKLPGSSQEWWGGMLLKIRDAKAYMKLTETQGKTVLTAEHLAANEKLAEVNFFLAHPVTGNGLYAHHSQSASLNNFGWLSRRLFNDLKKERCKDTLVGDHTTKEMAAIRKTFTGQLTLGQLCLETNLKELVRQLENVKSFEYKFTTVKTKEQFLRGIAQKAESETIRFVFPDDVDVDALATAMDATIANHDVEELKVIGKDVSGKSHTYHLAHNPLVFDEYDYDEKMKGLRLDLSDWSGSIKNSAVIAHLARVASANKVMQLLTKA